MIVILLRLEGSPMTMGLSNCKKLQQSLSYQPRCCSVVCSEQQKKLAKKKLGKKKKKKNLCSGIFHPTVLTSEDGDLESMESIKA